MELWTESNTPWYPNTNNPVYTDPITLATPTNRWISDGKNGNNIRKQITNGLTSTVSGAQCDPYYLGFTYRNDSVEMGQVYDGSNPWILSNAQNNDNHFSNGQIPSTRIPWGSQTSWYSAAGATPPATFTCTLKNGSGMPKSVCWGFFQYSPYQGNHTYDMDYFYTIEDSNGNVTTNGTQSNPKTLQWIRPNNTFFDTGYHSAGTSNNNGNNNVDKYNNDNLPPTTSIPIPPTSQKRNIFAGMAPLHRPEFDSLVNLVKVLREDFRRESEVVKP